MTDVQPQAKARCSIHAAEWPRDEVVTASLLRSYAAYLESGPNGTARIRATSLQDEIASLHVCYVEPESVLLLAWAGSNAAGCVAVKQIHNRPGAFEMKRLWTGADFRGMGVGRSLAEAAIAWARAHDAQVLLLDTQPEAMPHAVALYLSLGFTGTTRYNDNPVAGLLFMELRLR